MGSTAVATEPVRKPLVNWTQLLWLALGAIFPILAAIYAASTQVDARLLPWEPNMADLRVYREAAIDWFNGVDYYRAKESPFIYPPFALLPSLLLVPLDFTVTQTIWAGLNALMVMAVVYRLGFRSWHVSVISGAVLLWMYPFADVLKFGQLGILVLFLVFLDLYPGDGLTKRIFPRWRPLPTGVLTGIAAGLKLTPLAFIVLLFFIGRRRAGYVAVASFVGTVVVGFLLSPRGSLGYWTRLAGGDSGANPELMGWLNNQSIVSHTIRMMKWHPSAELVGLAISGLVLLATMVLCVVIARRGDLLLSLSLLGYITTIVNPVGWVHHMTWLLPLAIAAMRAATPMLLRASILATTVWYIVNPYWQLPYKFLIGPERDYTIKQNLFAAGGAFLTLAMLLILAWYEWQTFRAARTSEGAGEPVQERRDPGGAGTDDIGAGS